MQAAIISTDLRAQKTNPALILTPCFATSTDPLETITWVSREVPELRNGHDVYVTAPDFWSAHAIGIMARHYLAKQDQQHIGKAISRLADTLSATGRSLYMTDTEATTFNYELKWLLVHQVATFGSPVWYNLGIKDDPLLSSCFVNTVEDNAEDITELAKLEVKIFRSGAGSGCNWSKLRSSKELIRGESLSSGPVAFMMANDTTANKWKSGQKHRRAARLDLLNIDHPDIAKFIGVKSTMEKMAKDLVAQGWSTDMDVEYSTSNLVPMQGTNISVRLTDVFMRAVENDEPWDLKYVLSGETAQTVPARELWRKIAQSVWDCGDPGVQFADTINSWNTVLDIEPIEGTNVCSEIFSPNNTSCNLASINLLPKNKPISLDTLKQATQVMITAQDLITSLGSSPSPDIAKATKAYRPLGLGWSNFGAMLMCEGLAYDSDSARARASYLSSFMTGVAYKQSFAIAARTEPFTKADDCRDSLHRVLTKHRAASPCRASWDDVLTELKKGNLPRNCLVTAMMPTGTSGLQVGAATTGIEPYMWLQTNKKLSYGGELELQTPTIGKALEHLGYTDTANLAKTINEANSAVGLIKDEYLDVFDTAMNEPVAGRHIGVDGHLKMLAAIQPHISQGISKTVNLPETVTVAEIEQCLLRSWKLGIKSVALFRDNSKAAQILTSKTDKTVKKSQEQQTTTAWGTRKPLPDTRGSVTHKFSLDGTEVYITAGMYADGSLGEIWLTTNRQGSNLNGLLDSLAISLSLSLQYGVPVHHLVEKLQRSTYPPNGWTNGTYYCSLVDYLCKWIGSNFPNSVFKDSWQAPNDTKPTQTPGEISGETCSQCGGFLIQNGKCHLCPDCGQTVGGCGG